MTYSWKSREYYASLSWNYSLNSDKFIPGKAKISIFTRVSFAEPVSAQEEKDEVSEDAQGDDNSNAENDKQEGPLKKNDKETFSLKLLLKNASRKKVLLQLV